jgi:cytokinesis protein
MSAKLRNLASPQSSKENSNRSSASNAMFQNLFANRKDIPISTRTRMKQLQWDKLPQQQAVKTLWGSESPSKEQEWVNRLQLDGVWQEMEEGFKVKDLVRVLVGEFHQVIAGTVEIQVHSRNSSTQAGT